MANIGAILGGAFGVIRQRPGAVAVWGLTYVVGLILIFLLVGIAVAAGSVGMGGGAPPEFSGSMIGGVLLFLLAYLLLTVVLMNAVFRSVLRPHERSVASLRLGMDEFRMLGLQIIVWIAWIVLGFIMQLLMGLLMSLLIAATANAPQIGGALLVVLGLVYMGALIWLSVRISLLYPMTFYRRSIVLDEAWDLGRGSFWAIFLSYLVVFAPVVILYFVTFGRIFLAAMGAAGDPYAAQDAGARWAESWMGEGAVLGILLAVLWLVVLILTAVLSPAVMASAAKELLIARGDYSEQDVERTAEIFE